MRYKILIIGIVSAALAVSSCDEHLNYSELSNNDEDYIQLNFDNVAGLLSDIYAKLDHDFGNYGGGMLASATDEAEYAWESASVHNFFNGSWGPTNSLSNWDSMFAGIQGCNHYLKNYLGLTFPELALNDDYQAQMYRYQNYEHEVRFLRAYFYFNMVRQYGDVPFVTEVLSSSEINSLSRTAYKTVLNFIVSECDDIIPKLPADYSNLGSLAISPTQTGRASKLAAMALKARTLLYAASPLFNDGTDNQLWYKAAQASKTVIDSCARYSKTLPAYTRIWGTTNWESTEAILVKRIGGNNTNTLETRNFPIGVQFGNSGNCPTQNLVDAYQMKATGMFYDEAGSGYDPANPYDGRDPRFAMTIVKNGDTGWPSYNTNAIQTYTGGLNAEPISGATTTGYYLRKLLDGTLTVSSGSLTTSRHCFISYRLGEFYLNYAEAVFKHLGSADAISSEFPMSAAAAINVVRSRTGVEMPDLPAGLSDDEFWKQYTNERMVELAFEGHRFWDLRRWKEVDKLKSIIRMKITRNSDGTYTYNRVTVSRQWDDKMYFFPIPQSETMKNPNLGQNPGWGS